MNLAARGFHRCRGVAPVVAVCRGLHEADARLTERPHSLEEPVRAFDAGVRPLERGFRMRSEHHEQPRGIGAVAVDHVLRIDAVQLRLRHRAHPAVLDRLAVGLEMRADDVTFRVVLDLDGFGREVIDPALLVATEVDVVEHHPLREQPRERLVHVHESHVAHHLRPEARVEQVQDRVRDTADVLVHRVPVIVARGRPSPARRGTRSA